MLANIQISPKEEGFSQPGILAYIHQRFSQQSDRRFGLIVEVAEGFFSGFYLVTKPGLESL
jgi:hypothetical protein